MSTQFSAPAQATGYLYQLRYALFLLIAADKEETKLTIEHLDDVMTQDGEDINLYQLKHHSSPASLTDTHPDFWKTVRVWCQQLSSGTITPDAFLTLVTTATVSDSEGSTALHLLKQDTRSNTDEIITRLLEIAASSRNKTLKPAFEAFCGLSDTQRRDLIRAIRIIDSSESDDIEDLAERIKHRLRATIKPQYVEYVYSQLEGWWFNQAVELMNERRGEFITQQELRVKTWDIQDQVGPDVLPTDYWDQEPSEEYKLSARQRTFVEQLRAIALEHSHIESAILDYYRAFEERSAWLKNELVGTLELDKYEQELIEQWEIRRRWASYDEKDEESLRGAGREVYQWMETTDCRIRERVSQSYVARGSYHMLANEARVWWHPKFVERLEQLIDSTELAQLAPIDRPIEVLNLFNPAFCSMILGEAVASYFEKTNAGMPFSLVFLIMPVVLHAETRKSLPRSVRTKFHAWTRDHPEVLVGFAQRARSLNRITREAIMFGIKHGTLELSGNHIISKKKSWKAASPETQLPDAVSAVQRAARLVGRWYALERNPVNVYLVWGVRP